MKGLVVVVADTTFLRLIRGQRATRQDFTSRFDRGLPRRPEIGETEDDWRGISVQDSIEGVRRLVRRSRFGSNCAVMHIPDGSPILARKTHGPGHWTLWGDPQVMLDTVVEVVDVLTERR